MTRTPSAWIVLKFGGTSVSSLANWRNVAQVTRSRLDGGARVLIVHSAVTGITDRLEKLLDAALAQTHEMDLRGIEERHALNTTAPCDQARPEGVYVVSNRGDYTETGDHNTSASCRSFHGEEKYET